MNQLPSSSNLFQCSSCGNLGVGEGEIRCCDGAMQPVQNDDFTVEAPTFEELIQTVFGMSKTELDLCLCVMEGGELTVRDLAEQIDYDRSVVSRHLNHLVDLGVIDKRRRIRKGGGQVYVYTSNEPDVVRQNLMGAFLSWVSQATFQVTSLNRDKVEAMVGTDTQDPTWKIYQE